MIKKIFQIVHKLNLCLTYRTVLNMGLCLCVWSTIFVKYNRRISREWRQKIESWLQANEQDEKGEDHKRRARRLTGNRRSFENDSGLF